MNFKLSKNYVLLFLLLSVISCEMENDETTSYNNVEKSTPAAFISNTNTIRTQEILNGAWESFDSGSKSKWIFDGNELLKSNIYSFGEAGKPQQYTVEIKVACGGKTSDRGEYISLILNNSDGEKRMCYHIVNHSSSEIKLESKHGHSIILKKQD